MRTVIVSALAAGVLTAHPMGNFSVSHYSRFEVSTGGVALRYTLDLAEIPTFELFQRWDLKATSPLPELQARAAKQAREWASGLRILRGGRTVSPRLLRTDFVMADGAGGLPVARITAEFALPVTPGKIEFEDRNYDGRAGWKEIVVVEGEGASILRSSHTAQDRSRGLTAYPENPAEAPPQDLRATLEWASAAPVATLREAKPSEITPTPVVTSSAALAGSGTVVRGDYLSTLLGQHEIPWTLAVAGIGVAFSLGAMHAMSPGHGKTMVAAYLVGTRGTLKHAAILGASVTFTHTVSVFGLGLVTLFLSEYVVPERLYPVLGALSGVSIVIVGGLLLVKRLRSLRGHSHGHHHHHHHGHDHHHDHEHGPHTHTHAPEGDVTLASLIALGASGGLVPCPSALVLLLSAIALGRTGLGLVLLVGFSLGLATVLIAIGGLVVYARHLLPSPGRMAASPVLRLIPVASAAVVMGIGLVMTAASLV